jgi:Uma2 family endonuclease
VSTASRVTGAAVLKGVTYDEYVRYRDHAGNRGVRMIYHNGTLEIMSPAFRHEQPSDRLGMIVRAVAAVFSIPCIGSRCTTFRRGLRGTRRGSGKEPDNSFYFVHAARIRENAEIDLDVDPPPDLWIEVDNRGTSRGQFPLYAALGIPEIWRYRARRGTLWFGQLVGDRYEPIPRSLSLPMLTPSIVLDLLAAATQAPDETTWDASTRRWLAETLKPQFEAHA